jgi:hypothetical protein
MRSRLLVLALVAGCTPGAPPGFSGGSSWSFPLVTPLEGGPLLVPVTIEGKGPYLFQIDPDAPKSSVDQALQSELSLRGFVGPEFVDEGDKARNTMMAEVHHVKLGTLSVDATMQWLVFPVGTFNSGGHQVRGVLGRDVFADSLVWGFDRQAAMGWIATQKGFQKPEVATTITTRAEKSRITDGLRAVSRRLTHAIIDGVQRTVHVDLGDVHSQLRPKLWDGTKLTTVPLQNDLVDEVGSHRSTDQAGIAQTVEIGGITAQNVAFVPFDDRRWEDDEFDGTIGLGVFMGHRVWANQDSGTYFITDEQETTAQERIARWTSDALNACATPACTTATLLVPQEPSGDGASEEEKAPAPASRPVLAVSRTDDVASIAFEVMLDAGGDLPKLLAIFPAGETQVTIALDASYAGATFQVVDVSPFPRACPEQGKSCVYQLK